MRQSVTARHLAWLAPLFVIYALVSLFGPHDPSDEGAYLAFADRLSNGFYSGRGEDVDLWFGPGLPLLLVPFVALEVPVEIIRLLGPVLLFIAVVLFYGLLRLTTTPSTAFVGALALALYWPTLRLLPTLHSELPAMLFLVCFMLAFTVDVRRPGPGTISIAAASLALLAVTRVVFGWVLVATLVLALATLLFRRERPVARLALAVAFGLALTTPWLAYTYEVTGKPFYWSTSGGLSLYWMSSPYPGEHGDWHSGGEVRTSRDLAAHRPLFERLRERDVNQVAFDEAVFAEARRLIREHPRAYLENVAANVSRLWFSTPYSHTPQKLSTTFYTVPNAFLLAFLTAAAVVMVSSSRRRPEAVPFALILIPGVGVQALLSGYPRMLVPLVPTMLWFIVQSAASLFSPVREGRRPKAANRTRHDRTDLLRSGSD